MPRSSAQIDGERLGHVDHIVETGGVDVLAVRDASGGELLIPMAPSILIEIDEVGPLKVDLPKGLRELED